MIARCATALSFAPSSQDSDQGEEQEERGHDDPASLGLAKQVSLARMIEIIQGQHGTGPNQLPLQGGRGRGPTSVALLLMWQSAHTQMQVIDR